MSAKNAPGQWRKHSQGWMRSPECPVLTLQRSIFMRAIQSITPDFL